MGNIEAMKPVEEPKRPGRDRWRGKILHFTLTRVIIDGMPHDTPELPYYVNLSNRVTDHR